MRISICCILALLPALGDAQETPWRSAEHVARIPRAELDSITARGWVLVEYDQAAWHGTDAVLALRPRDGTVQGYLARQQQDGRWEVVFGRLSAGTDTFYVAYRAEQREVHKPDFSATELRPLLADVGYFARGARALDVCRKDFGPVSRPYNAMVVPVAGSDEWFVYLVPAPTQAGVWPLGGDIRYRVSNDGRTIRERRRLHNAVLEFPPPSKDGSKLMAGTHAAVLADRPEDTDVFHVVTREPQVPEYIVTRSYYFRIDIDGRIMAYDRDTTVRW